MKTVAWLMLSIVSALWCGFRIGVLVTDEWHEGQMSLFESQLSEAESREAKALNDVDYWQKESGELGKVFADVHSRHRHLRECARQIGIWIRTSHSVEDWPDRPPPTKHPLEGVMGVQLYSETRVRDGFWEVRHLQGALEE